MLRAPCEMEFDLSAISPDPEGTTNIDPGSIAKASMLSLISLPEDVKEKLQEVEFYNFTRQDCCPVWDKQGTYDTKFGAINWDTLETAKIVNDCNLGRVAVLNMANEWNCGGGFERTWGSQEEMLFRRSSIGFNLWPYRRRDDNRIPEIDKDIPRRESKYPLTECGGIYSPNVVVLRNIHGYHYRSAPYEPNERYMISMLSVAAQDLRYWMSHVKEEFSLELTKEKIRTMLYMAASHNHQCIILGAFGCGAFQNDPKLLADIFKSILETEYKGVFRLVLFAIIKSEYNLSSFAGKFGEIKLGELEKMKGKL